jgi:hypothetical protein
MNTMNNMNNTNTIKNIYYTKGRFTIEQIDDYIKSHLTIKEYKLIDDMMKKMDHSDKYIDFLAINTSNPNGYTYNELLLLDISHPNSLYLSVYISNINTSSPYAIMRLYTNYDEDEYFEDINVDDVDEENDSQINTNTMTIDELKNCISKDYNIQKIINLVTQ